MSDSRPGRFLGWIAFLILGIALLPAPVLAQQIPAATMSIPQAAVNGSFDWNFSTGLDYTTGKYGANCTLKTSLSCVTTGTTVISIPATAMLQIERLRLQLTLPYVDIEGPGRVSGDIGIPVVVAPASNDPKHRSGLGDASVGLAWILLRETALMPTIEIAGIVKLPTAAKGLGTGKTDYGAQLNLYRKLAPGLTSFGSVGYQWIGDINTVHLHSGATASAGLDWNLLFLSLGPAVNYSQPAWSGAPSYLAMNPYITWHMLGGLGISVYATIGLTRSTPSRGAGIRVSL